MGLSSGRRWVGGMRYSAVEQRRGSNASTLDDPPPHMRDYPLPPDSFVGVSGGSDVIVLVGAIVRMIWS
jgi:hypothetical protein